MAGFGKKAVIQQLEARLAEQVKKADAIHERETISWEEQRDKIQRAKKNVRQAVRDLTDGKIEIEEFTKRIVGKGGRYDVGWLNYSKLTVEPKPKRSETSLHKSITEKIALVKSFEGDAFSVTEMKAIGVLDLVRG